jgi:hypothetical protein
LPGREWERAVEKRRWKGWVWKGEGAGDVKNWKEE